MWNERNTYSLLVRVAIFAASVEKVWRLLKKFKIGLPHD